ncbi:MAG: histidine kinase dimerization/phospho-acceptor domain-containing protein [Acidimicrobiia bacterium]|nr:histidine kinase dimerization/phospho-acceptor domain-containing protein [Acidimicrobiia bacterium]
MSNRDGNRAPLALALVAIVIVAFAVASALELASHRTKVQQWTSDQAAVAERAVQEAVDAVVADVEAVTAFIEETDPTPEQFVSFTNRIEGFDGAVGIGYLTAVSASEIEQYIATQKELHGDWYHLFEFVQGSTTAPVDLSSRDMYYPIGAFAVGAVLQSVVEAVPAFGQLGIGLDAGYDPIWGEDLAAVIAHDGPLLSHFITLEFELVTLERVFFVLVPVRSEDGSERRMVMAMMHEPLLISKMSTEALQRIDWEVVPPGGTPSRVESPHTLISPIELPGTTWSLAVAPTDDALADLEGLPWWTTSAAVATLAAFAALALWLFVDRRNEHRRVRQFRQLADDKDRFLASVSHELRTPLTVVSGLAYELHDKPANFAAEEQRSLLAMLLEQTNELTGIVEDLLIAARSDIGKVAIHYEEVDLGAEVRSAMETSGVNGPIAGKPATAHADAQRVRQILRNLLTNAKRYGGPEIRIELAEGTGWAEIVVADNGDGVPRPKRESIFEPYHSAHSPSTDVGSVGLGLFISRNLAVAMGGELEYVRDGAWSRFRLRLRAATGSPVEDAPHGADQKASTSSVSNVA